MFSPFLGRGAAIVMLVQIQFDTLNIGDVEWRANLITVT